jgi:hypothetical protein
MKKKQLYRLCSVAVVVAATLLIWRGNMREIVPTSGTQGVNPAAVPTTEPKAKAINKGESDNTQKTVRTKNADSTFSSMTRAGQLAILEKIRTMNTYAMFQMWISSGISEPDLLKQHAVGTLLGSALRTDSTALSTLQEIQAFISNDSNSVLERARLIQVLGRTGSKETQDILIATATSAPDTSLRGVASNEIADGADFRGDGKFHEELSPALESAWGSTEEKALLVSTAHAIARIGSPSGVKVLLDSALLNTSTEGFRVAVARNALAEVRNPNAVSMLSTRLAAQTTVNDETVILGNTLVAIGKPIAVEALLGWLQQANEDAAPLVNDYVSKSRTNAVLRLWKSALEPSVPFLSEKIRDAIRTGVAEVQSREGSKS